MSKLSLGVVKVLPKLNGPAAQSLDAIVEHLRAGGFEAFKLVYLSQSWKELGFASFEAWAASHPKYQLSRDDRRALIIELDGLGMTQRQIAASVGASKGTVSTDFAQNRAESEPDRAQSEAPVGRNRAEPGSPPESKPIRKPEPEHDLHEAAKGIPATDKEFRATVDLILSTLAYGDVEDNQPITEEKIEEVRRLLDRLDEFRQDWLPYIQPRFSEVR